jgi:hypothetical protein
VRSPGARYWIPNLDEWTKAVYFDPNRYGEGQPGYWMYPHRSDSPPQLGLPSEGGQTSAQLGNRSPESAAYTNIQTPWGLWDASGGASEWLEDKFSMPGRPSERDYKGSSSFRAYDMGQRYLDQAYFSGSTGVDIRIGMRLARQVPGPGPGGAVLLVSVGVLSATRRRR